MRELNTTGFMHNRVRMIVASFLVKDLHIDWRWGERYFAQHLVDYDPCVNNGSWQWAASIGCDAQPYFRIFNPWLQQLKFDHDCRYIYHWLPELQVFPPKTVHEWYKKSLAYFQNKSLNDRIIDKNLSLLKDKKAIAEENEKLITKPIGKVASMFYFSPFDAADLYTNFYHLFNKNNESDDYAVSIALGNIDSHKLNIVSKAEKDEIDTYSKKIRATFGDWYNEPALKAGYCYYNLLNGNPTQACAPLQRGLKVDFNRVSQVLQALDTFGGNWNKSRFFKDLEGRIATGVPAHLIDLCRIPNVAKVRATRLYDYGIKTVEDFVGTDFEVLKKVLAGTRIKDDTLKELIKDANKIVLIG